MAVIAVIGTLDTKGEEHSFVAARIREQGHEALMIDVGTGGPASVVPDISREQVAAEAGIDLGALAAANDRGLCIAAMSQAAPELLARLAAEGRIHGAISLGGGGGTAIASAAMRALPLGFPKLIVSTLAAGETRHYVGTKDITLMPSVIDVAGLNRLSRIVFSRAAGAICGMVEASVEDGDAKPLIVASMFGNTTPCVTEAKRLLENAGYEVLVFPASGAGGQAMEALIESGRVSGVLDLTTTEWADELVGGTLSAGPARLDAAAKMKIPTVIAPGCLDMVNFGEPDTVPDRFSGRLFYPHNPQVTLMRTSADEAARLGEILAGKVNGYGEFTTVMIPRLAISQIGARGGAFHDPAADKALFDAIRSHCRKPVEELEEEINSPAFAKACAERLLSLLQSAGQTSSLSNPR